MKFRLSRWWPVFVARMLSTSLAHAQEDDSCLAAFSQCRPEQPCNREAQLYAACRRSAPRPHLELPSARDIDSCRAQIERARLPSGTPPNELAALLSQTGSNSFDPRALRTGTAVLLDHLVSWAPLPANLQASLASVCRFAYPEHHKVECSDAFDGFEKTLLGALNRSELMPGAPHALRSMLHSHGEVCTGAGVPLDDAWRYVVLLAHPGERAAVFQAGSTGVVERVFDALPLSLPAANTANVLLIAIPKALPALVRIEAPTDRVTHFIDLTASVEDELLDVRVTARSCVSLELRLSAGGHVLVDGQLIHRAEQASVLKRSLSQSAATLHRLSILEAVGDSSRPAFRTLQQRDIEASAERASSDCTRLEMDASQDAVLDLAVLPFHVAPQCQRAGVNEVTVRDRVISYLSDIERRESSRFRVRDLSALDAIVREVADVESLVARLQGTPFGPDRGQQHSASHVYRGAKEMLRQGFDRVISFTLLCGNTSAGWEYSAAVRSANLVGLRNVEPEVVKWEHVFESQTQLMTDRRELFDGVVAPVARMLRVPYAIFIRSPASQSFASKLQVPIEVYDPRCQPIFQPAVASPSRRSLPRVRVASANAFDCQLIDDRTALRSLDVVRHDSWDSTWSEVGESARFAADERPGDSETRPTKYRIEILGSPVRTGRFMLALEQDQKTLPSERCMEIVSDGAELFVSLHWKQWSVPKTGAPERPESYENAFVLAGFEPASGFGVAGLAGVSVTTRRGQTPPSFEGIGSGLSFDARGQHEYLVVERSLLIGAAIVWQDSVCIVASMRNWSLCSGFFRRLHVLARVAPLLSFSFADRDEVEPTVFPRSRNGELADIDVDLSALASVGVGFHISDHNSLRFLFHALIPKLSDSFGTNRNRTSPTYDNRILFGLGLEYGRNL